ncbi:hypothetical protein C8Q72DRAFT_575661 [Fomitopsis betulina]|nr:hypothetical protein C8Q72DRAFT_575661 [Fomitopsis betulina]
MAWKRMFSFRTTASTNGSPILSPSTTRATLADPAGADGASTSTIGATPGVRSRERSTSEATAARRGESLWSVSTNDSASRSLNLTSASETPQVRTSFSTESLLEFNHSDDSRSTLSLSLSCQSLHGHESTASSKSTDMLPHPPPKSKPKRRENVSFPYFVTPLVLTTANPYVMPPTPPSSPTSSIKPNTRSSPPLAGTLPKSAVPSVRDTPTKESHSPNQENQSPPAPATIFEKITGAPRKRLVSRASYDGVALASSPSTLTSPRPPPALFDDRPTSSPIVGPARVSRAPTKPAAQSISNAGEDERIKVAVSKKTRVGREVREARDTGEDLPRSRPGSPHTLAASCPSGSFPSP